MKPKSGSDASGIRLIFRSLRYRNYRLFFLGDGISVIGTWMQRIAMGWLVYRLTNSAFLLGAVGFAGQLPTFILAPLAGVLTDRYNRHTVLLVTQTLAMVQALILAILVITGIIQVWHIVVLSVVLSLINAFDIPARQSFVVEMVERREDLGNAIALNSSIVNIGRLLGPSIAGILIAAAGEGWCFLVNGLSYLAVIWSLLMMKLNHSFERKARDVLYELKEGFNYALGFAPIRSIILLLALVSLMGMPYQLLMPVFAKDILHGGPHTFGFLMAATGLGALLGALYLASLKSVLGLERTIALAAGLFGFGLVAFSFSTSILFSLLLLLATGFGMMVQMASSNTVLQSLVDDDKRGRVMSFYTMAFIGVMPFGSLLAGTLASMIGAPDTLLIGGVLCILGSILFAMRLPKWRRMARPVYVERGIIPEGMPASGIPTLPGN